MSRLHHSKSASLPLALVIAASICESGWLQPAHPDSSHISKKMSAADTSGVDANPEKSINMYDEATPALQPAIDAWSEGEFQECMKILKIAAKQGDREAAKAMGDIYRHGKLTLHRYTNLYGYAPVGGWATFFSDDSIEENSKLAFRYYRQASDGGSVPAMYELGTMYFKGKGTPKDQDRGRKLWKRAATKGYPPAMTAYADSALYFDHDDQDAVADALVMIRDAASQEYAPAIHMLSRFYDTGQHAISKDESASYALAARAATMGYQIAILDLAHMQIDGSGCVPNPTAGFGAIKQLAESGYKPAMQDLALLYEVGTATDVNKERAKYWRDKVYEK